MHGRSSTRRWLPLATLAILSLSFLSAGLRSADGFSSAQSAVLAVGEPDLNTSVNPSMAFKIPSNFAFDSSGNLWVADSGNNRVIEEPAPAPGSTSFMEVLGQPGYTTGLNATTQTGLDNPSGLATDSSGNLWVADTNNNRVLEYAAPFTPGEAASTVIGQSSFTTATTSYSPAGLSSPGDVLFDSSGDLWVVDTGNSRVLEYTAPLTTGMSASLVIGQGNLTTPSAGGVSSTALYYPTDAVFDSAGNLWLADSGNSRILEFKAPFSTGMSASLVIGQPTFTSDSQGTTQGSLSFPDGVAFDSTGDLWVADGYNSRVLEYTAPFTNGMGASAVLGQQGYTTGTPSTSESGLNSPTEVAFNKAGDLWVADAYNNRLVEFAPPFTSGSNVFWEIGQSGYTSSLYQGQLGLYGPETVALDPSGNLWATDSQNNRVVEYSAPFTTGMAASVAIGQSNLTRSLGTDAASGLSYPWQAVFDSSGDLWVSDSGNNRILEYTAPFKTGMNASLVLGQPSLDTDFAETTPTGLYFPTGMAFDSSGDLWVSDFGNSRILEFKPPFTTDMSASLVLGQSSFGGYRPGLSSSQVSGPIGLAFDPTGNLWVADAYNDRVLEFPAPFTSGEQASLVIGQSLFTTNLAVASQTGLYFPSSVGFDRSGDLWVSDSGNNRVLEYEPRFSTGMAASLVLGQSGFGLGTGSTSPAGLSNPLGLAFDTSGNLWLADSDNNRLLEFQGPSGGSTTSTTKTSSTSSNGVVTVTVSSASSSLSSTTFSSGSSTTSTTTTKSTVPEFPLGAPVVLLTVVFATAVLVSTMRRRHPAT